MRLADIEDAVKSLSREELAKLAAYIAQQDEPSWDPPWNQNMISEAGRMKLGMV